MKNSSQFSRLPQLSICLLVLSSNPQPAVAQAAAQAAPKTGAPTITLVPFDIPVNAAFYFDFSGAKDQRAIGGLEVPIGGLPASGWGFNLSPFAGATIAGKPVVALGGGIGLSYGLGALHNAFKGLRVGGEIGELDITGRGHFVGGVFVEGTVILFQ